MFLNKKVLSRELRTSRYKQSRTTATRKKVQQTLKFDSVDSYVSAIISLYNYQQSFDHATSSHSREAKVKALLKDRTKKKHARRKAQYLDRDVNTLLNEYKQRQMIDVVRSCWTHELSQKRATAQTVKFAHRTTLDFLMSHMMLMRGENRRHLQLTDLFSLNLKNENLTPCTTHVCILNNEKTNQTERIEYETVVRHKNSLLCIILQLAFYLFYRWNIVREQISHFQRRQQWYDLHLLRGSKSTSPMSYEVQLEWTNKMFDVVSIFSLKKTHDRDAEARAGELSDASKSQIRRAERWNTDALFTSYLTHLSLKFVRVMTGFKPASEDFFLSRAKVEPSLSLVRALWPWIDHWLAWFSDPSSNASYENHKSLLDESLLDTAGKDRFDMTAQDFLRLLKKLRIVILQNSIIYRREFPAHLLWKDSLFVRDDYLTFANEVELSLLNVEKPDELRIRSVVPDIVNRISMTSENIVRSIQHHDSCNHQILESLHDRMKNFFAGKFSVTLHGSAALPSGIVASSQLMLRPSYEDNSDFNVASSQLSSQSSYEVDSSLNDLQRSKAASYEGISGAQASQASPSLNPDAVPSEHHMCRTVSTVSDLWREWMLDWGSASVIQALKTTYEAKWRLSQQERVFFDRRKVIIDEIHRRTQSNQSSDAVVKELKLVRRRLKVSLHELWSWLNKKSWLSAVC